MIRWMSKEVDELIDGYRNEFRSHYHIALTVCSGGEKGHIELRCEFADELDANICLGDCTGLSDSEINERFVREFAKVIPAAYGETEDCHYDGERYLAGLSEAMLKTIGK